MFDLVCAVSTLEAVFTFIGLFNEGKCEAVFLRKFNQAIELILGGK